MKNIKNSIILFLSITLLICAGYLNEALIKPELNIEKQDSAVNINSDFLKFFNAGYSRLISDVLWITTLLESDHEHYKKRDLNSWMYLRFKSIITLDPLFLQAYQFGGKYLSIIKDDLNGAKEILDKGLTNFPNNYELLISSAFLYSFELNNNIKGSKLFERASTFPQAPIYLKTLSLKLKFQESNNLDLAFELLKKTFENEENEIFKAKIKKDLYAIRAEIDLKCLNSSKNKTKCNTLDYNNNAYLFYNQTFHAPEEFKPYRLRKR